MASSVSSGLRSRVRQRLQENAEVVGTDETFFEDEKHDTVIRDLFTEKSGILDDPADDEVDLASLAYQIWKNACDTNPSLKKTIPDLPGVIFSTKALSAVPAKPAGAAGPQPASGVMVYVRTADGNDALAWVDEEGRTVTESQHEILRAAACEPDTPTFRAWPTTILSCRKPSAASRPSRSPPAASLANPPAPAAASTSGSRTTPPT